MKLLEQWHRNRKILKILNSFRMKNDHQDEVTDVNHGRLQGWGAVWGTRRS